MKKTKSVLLTTPYILWMVAFTLIPLGVVAYYALTDPATGEFSLTNIRESGNVSAGAGVLHLVFPGVLGHLPAAGLSRGLLYCPPVPTAQKFLYMLVMLPMCMSFLLRTLAWVGLLQDTGIINTLLSGWACPG